MAFGPIMRMKVGDYLIELAPPTKESIQTIISPGLQQASVTKYLNNHFSPTIEDQIEWYEKTRTAKNQLVWGVWLVGKDNERTLIGSTALNDIEGEQIMQATSGSLIADKQYWNKGIASAIHKAQTWYAFEQRGLTRIKSAVYYGNIASRRALEKTGYSLVYVERNVQFIDGQFRHMDNLECLNPAQESWRTWWRGERPQRLALEARQRTLESLDWARENVTLL